MDSKRTKAIIKNAALAAPLLAGVFVLGLQTARAEDAATRPNTTATRPAKEGPDQTSVPNNAPPATATQPTGEANNDPTIKKMNEDEKQKVDTKGK